MLNKIIESEEITKDRKRLMNWQEEMRRTDAQNTYDAVKEVITKYIKSHKLVTEELDLLYDVLDSVIE